MVERLETHIPYPMGAEIMSHRVSRLRLPIQGTSGRRSSKIARGRVREPRNVSTDFLAVFYGPVGRWGPWRLNLQNIRIQVTMLQPEGCVGLHLPTGTKTTIAMMNSRAAATIAVTTVMLTEGDVER